MRSWLLVLVGCGSSSSALPDAAKVCTVPPANCFAPQPWTGGGGITKGLSFSSSLYGAHVFADGTIGTAQCNELLHLDTNANVLSALPLGLTRQGLFFDAASDGSMYLSSACHQYMVGAVDAELEAFTTDAVRWVQPLGTNDVDLVAATEGPYIVNNYYGLFAMDAATGGLRWQSGMIGNLLGVLPDSRGHVLVGANNVQPSVTFTNALLYMYDQDGNRLWTKLLRSDSQNLDTILPAALTPAGDFIVELSTTGRMVDFGDAMASSPLPASCNCPMVSFYAAIGVDGTTKWLAALPAAAGNPLTACATAVDDNSVILGGSYDADSDQATFLPQNMLIRLSSSGAMTTKPIPLGCRHLQAAADGTVWLTDTNAFVNLVPP